MKVAWDCYSPVALVLWRAADFAEAGVIYPISQAAGEVDTQTSRAVVQFLSEVRGYFEVDGHDVLYLRERAEFGPAGEAEVSISTFDLTEYDSEHGYGPENPREPRPAPTREEFEENVRRIIQGTVGASTSDLAHSLLAAFDAIAAERDAARAVRDAMLVKPCPCVAGMPEPDPRIAAWRGLPLEGEIEGRAYTVRLMRVTADCMLKAQRAAADLRVAADALEALGEAV